MPGFAPRPACQANYCRSIYSNRSGSKAERYERILAHRIDCQRAISPPVQQKGKSTTKEVYAEPVGLSTPQYTISTSMAVGIRSNPFLFRCTRTTSRMPVIRAIRSALIASGSRVVHHDAFPILCLAMRHGGARFRKRALHAAHNGCGCLSAPPLLPCADMGQSLVRRVQSAIEKGKLLRAGERVGVAVSGGADSVALLLLLLELRAKLGVVLSVVHFNHELRGKASEADEKFVAKLAAKHGLPFHSGHADVAAKAKRDKTNLEDTARRVRYEFFAMLVDAKHLDKIAVAHTMDDQAETVLAHILRGTGLGGLGGIHPVVGHVVRPLLTVRSAELRTYLRSTKQTWHEDLTNRDTARTRAPIRKKLLPMLEKNFQPTVVAHLATLADLAREDEAFLGALVDDRMRRCVEK